MEQKQLTAKEILTGSEIEGILIKEMTKIRNRIVVGKPVYHFLESGSALHSVTFEIAVVPAKNTEVK